MEQVHPFMTKKKMLVMLLCVGLGLFAGVALQKMTLDTVASPLLYLGGALRNLAQLSWWGNILTWLIVLDVTLAPVVYAICRQYKAEYIQKRPKASYQVDWLLPLLSLQIFAFCFLAMNPTYIPSPEGISMQGAYLAVTVWAMVATVGSYILLRFAMGMQTLPVAKTAALLPKLLQGSALLVFFLYAASAGQQFCAVTSKFQPINLAEMSQPVAVLLFLSILNLCVVLCSGVVLLWCGEVAHALLQSPYQPQTIALCKCRAGGCVSVLVFTVVAEIVSNLTQLLFFTTLQDISIQWNIPLLSLLLAGALFLLCHYVSGACEIYEDNTSII